MARCLAVPQDSDIDANSASLRDITPLAGVVHDTIGFYTGPDSGDSQYIENHLLAHFVVGEDEGEWEQLIDTEKFAAHANGANRYAFGIEFSRIQAGMPLTEWQKDCWAIIRDWAVGAHGIPNTYLDPTSVPDASVWVNSGTFHGWISHTSVKTDDDTPQHSDWVPYADFADTPPVPPAQQLVGGDMDMFVGQLDKQMGFETPAGAAPLHANIPLALLVGPGGRIIDTWEDTNVVYGVPKGAADWRAAGRGAVPIIPLTPKQMAATVMVDNHAAK